jgi:hypothetical protein
MHKILKEEHLPTGTIAVLEGIAIQKDTDGTWQSIAGPVDSPIGAVVLQIPPFNIKDYKPLDSK